MAFFWFLGADPVWGLWGLKPPYPPEFYGVKRGGRGKKREMNKKKGCWRKKGDEHPLRYIFVFAPATANATVGGLTCKL